MLTQPSRLVFATPGRRTLPSDSATGTPEAPPIGFDVVAVPNGFCARLTCAAKDWISYNASVVFIRYAARDSEPITTLVYEPEAGQNITLQKTVLNLSANLAYSVQFLLFDAEGSLAFTSAPHSVTPLP